jgi:hypothetical protein
MVLSAQRVPLSFLLEWTMFWEEEYFVKHLHVKTMYSEIVICM